LNKQFTMHLVLGVVLLGAWFFAALLPYFAKYSAVGNQVIEAEQKLADFQQTILFLPDFVKTRNELAQRKAELNSSLYTKDNIVSLFEKFYLLADKNHVQIVEITPPLEELLQINRILPDSVGLIFLNISLRIEGNYQDFGRLVSALEEEPFYRGPNHCNIVGTYDRHLEIQYHFGFKSLLWSLKEKV